MVKKWLSINEILLCMEKKGKYKGNQDWQSVAFIIEEEDCDLPLEVPATSYSSSEDEDFFDAEEDQKSPKVSPA